MVFCIEPSILELPDEMICEILSHLGHKDIFWFSFTCKRFLNLSFSLSHGLFEIDLSDTRLGENNLENILASPNVSSMVKHLFVAHPVDSTSPWVERINRSQEKGMIYEKYSISAIQLNAPFVQKINFLDDFFYLQK